MNNFELDHFLTVLHFTAGFRPADFHAAESEQNQLMDHSAQPLA